MTAVGMVMVDAAAVPARASDAGSGFEEMMPDGNDRLTRPELRWCLFESIRLDGVLAEVHANKNWGKDSYDTRASAYRKSCVNRNYEEGTRRRSSRN